MRLGMHTAGSAISSLTCLSLLGPIRDVLVSGRSAAMTTLRTLVAELEGTLACNWLSCSPNNQPTILGLDPRDVGIAPVPRIFPYSTCPTEVEDLRCGS
jgi:hypothetical protein